MICGTARSGPVGRQCPDRAEFLHRSGAEKFDGANSQFVDWAACEVLNRSPMVLSGNVPSDYNLAHARSAKTGNAACICRFLLHPLIQEALDRRGHTRQMQIVLVQFRDALQPIGVMQGKPAVSQRDESLSS